VTVNPLKKKTVIVVAPLVFGLILVSLVLVSRRTRDDEQEAPAVPLPEMTVEKGQSGASGEQPSVETALPPPP